MKKIPTELEREIKIQIREHAYEFNTLGNMVTMKALTLASNCHLVEKNTLDDVEEDIETFIKQLNDSLIRIKKFKEKS